MGIVSFPHKGWGRWAMRKPDVGLLEALPRYDKGPLVRFVCSTGAKDKTAYRFEFFDDAGGKACDASVVADGVVGKRREIVVSVPVGPRFQGGSLKVMAPGTTEPACDCAFSAEEIDQACELRKKLTLHAQAAPHHDWMLAHKASMGELASQREEARSWPEDARPLISIVTPVFRPRAEYLRAMIDSVLAQSYDNLELLLVNASGVCPAVDDVLASYDDKRIRILPIENKNISENTNAGLAAAQGSYVAFIDHDDFIEPDALYRYVRELHEHPDCDLMFCDEDLYGPLEEEGGQERYYGVRFKPGWNPDLLFTHNYVCHMLMVSKHALDATSRSGADVAAAQDYDLTFKVAEMARCIRHVPRVLYHWREHEASTALNRDSKPYAEEAGRLAIQAHFDRIGLGATVHKGAFPFSYRLQYHLPEPAISVSLVVACVREDEQALARLLHSLRSVTDYPWERYEIIVAASNGFSKAACRAMGGELESSCQGTTALTHVKTSSRKAPKLWNAGAQEAHNEIVVFLDEACEAVEGNWLTELIEPLQRDDVACTGPMLIARDGLIEALGLITRPDGTFGQAGRGLEITDHGYMTMLFHAHDCDVLPAQGLALRRDDFLAREGFDGSFGELSPADLCLRMREAGKLVVVEPYGPLGTSARADYGTASPAKRTALVAAHPDIVRCGAYANPNIDPASDYFALRPAATDA